MKLMSNLNKRLHMDRILSAVATVSLGLAAMLPLGAKVRLAPLFSDNMVLQQKCDAPVFGFAEPGKEITVKVSWDKKRTYGTTAGEDGKWMVKVRTLKAGGPHSITVSDGDDTVLDNILFGEVWLCSGQSNMEMPLAGWGKVKDFETEIRDASHPDIRLFQAKHVTATKPQDVLPDDFGGWVECSPETVPQFSATAYFFARELNAKEHVPVGLIHSSWGGTYIETWIRKEAFDGIPYIERQIDALADYGDSREDMESTLARLIGKWEHDMTTMTEGYSGGRAVYAETAMDDGDWQTVNLPMTTEESQLVPAGQSWFRKKIDIPQEWEGKELKITFPGVDDIDFTYFNGVKVGKGFGWRDKRTYIVPADIVKAGEAVIAVMAVNNSGAGGIVGDAELLKIENSEGGVIPLSGECRFKITADISGIPAYPVDITRTPNYPTLLFNAMISPLIPYAIKGAIWYQGCNNVGCADRYADYLPLMIEDWRGLWGYEFPFYIAQLANYLAPQTAPENSAWAELREAQEKAARCTGNSGLAVLIDIGEAMDIHPKNKQEVGRRLALQALNKTYGHEGIICDGPVLEGYEIEEGAIRLKFSSCGKGLEFRDGKAAGFTIAGADHKFHWADAVIDGNTVVVSSPEVRIPLAVRYGWANNPVTSLYNSAGLPASPFRTDSWK